MKLVKRLLTIIAASVLVLSMGGMKIHADDPTYTFAVENNNATEANKNDYEYLLYQMFKGDISINEEGKQVLSNISWGNGVKDTTKETMYTLAGLTGDDRNAANFAKWLSGKDQAVFHELLAAVGVNNGSSLQNPVTLEYGDFTIAGESQSVHGFGKTGLEGGYYLVRNTKVPNGETCSDYIVFVLNKDTKATPKASPAPTHEKKVTDKNDSKPLDSTVNGSGDSADYDIGDDIPYTLKVTLPDNYESYVKYKVVFTDEMSKGLTYNGDAKIYFGESDTGTTISLEETEGSSLYGTDGKTYTYTIPDLKDASYSSYNLRNGSVITIKYTAKLNKDAVIGSVGNPNAFTLEYSNNPTGDSLGKTEPDKNTVFTFQLVFSKTDGQKNPLSGADFILYKWISSNDGTSGSWVDITTLGTTENHPSKTKSGTGATSDCVFTFSGLDDGKYKLHESQTPTGYNTIEDIEFTVTATHTGTAVDPQLTDLSASGDTITMTPSLSGGTLSADIKNESGSTLPTTGAKGTSFLVIGGSVIALIGILILVTRRRMMAE